MWKWCFSLKYFHYRAAFYLLNGGEYVTYSTIKPKFCYQINVIETNVLNRPQQIVTVSLLTVIELHDAIKTSQHEINQNLTSSVTYIWKGVKQSL